MSDLSSVLNIRKRFGDGSIMRLNAESSLSIPVIPTGILKLDLALGAGGLPRGRITEIYGPEQSGKTTFCHNVISQAQMLGDLCAFVDSEHDFDPAWAEINGVDTENLYISQPDNAEQALEIVEMLLDDFGCIVIDSVAALVPKAEIEGDMGDAHMGLQARLMGQAMRKLRGKIKRANSVVIFTNQLRDRIGVLFGSPETTTGGKALRFYASVRLDIRKRKGILDGKEVIGNEVEVTVKKNKVGVPYKKTDFEILYSVGVNHLRDVIDLAIGSGIIKQGGAWYTFTNGDEEIKCQGKDELNIKLADKLWLIENQVRQHYRLPLYLGSE